MFECFHQPAGHHHRLGWCWAHCSAQYSKLLLNSIMVKISERWLNWSFWTFHFSKNISKISYIISILEGASHGGVHVVMIQSHESCVNHNAKSYKEINKWIEDNKREKLCQFDIAATAVPHTHDLHQLNTELAESLLESGMRGEVRRRLTRRDVSLGSHPGPSPSSMIVDRLAEGRREACSMISLRTITSANRK